MNRPPKAPTDPVRPSALPGRATLRASSAILWSWEARPSYCSGSSSCAAPGRGPCVVLACWCGLSCRPRSPRKQALRGAGARHVRIQLRPPRASRSLQGEWGRPPGPGGGGGPVLPRPAGRGGGVGERGGGRAVPLLPPPCPLGWPLAPVPVTLRLRCAPLGYTCAVRGCRAAVGASRSVWRGGGERSPRPGPLPSLPQAGTRVDSFVCAILGAAGPQHARTTHGPRPGVARDDEPEQYGGRAPHDQSKADDARNVARPGRAEGRTGSVGASGGRFTGCSSPPPPPPTPGWPAGGRPHPAHKAAPRPQPNAYAREEYVSDERGAG